MYYKNTRRGFTLIELLVVVLIIGILAAIALPQYQLAVYKARLMKAVPLAKALRDAQEVYFLEHGQYTYDVNQLNFTLPGDCSASTHEDWAAKIYINCPGVSVQWVQHGLDQTWANIHFSINGRTALEVRFPSSQAKKAVYLATTHNLCYIFQDSRTQDMARRVCKALGGKQVSSVEDQPAGEQWEIF